ncbi:MAG: cupin-like domain-containing protein [Deltaproteobacteria bacterium]|nr:cupin-like domain-containing protein [Deltaproteobacteria bacterium]
MDIPRIDPVEPARFERDYRRPRRPVVMRGLVGEDELRHWSFDAIAAADRDLAVATHATRAGAVTADARRGIRTELRALAELLAQLGGGAPPSLYMMARLQDLPAAWRARIATPVYCADAPWLTSKVWLSPAGTVTLTHRDAADNLHLQLLGSKRFTLFDPSERASLYPNSLFSSVPHGCKVDPEAPDLLRYPRFRDARAERAELAPGDGIYIPRGTWHHVRTTMDSLSVNFWWARGARLPLVAGAALFKRLRRIG